MNKSGESKRIEKLIENRGVLPLLFVGVLMGALDISIVGPAIPSIESTMNINGQFSGWIFSIYVLFNLMGISLFARLSDVFGRQKIYIIAIAIFAIGSIIVSISDSYNILLIGRAIQGFGSSGIFPVASALIGDLYPVEKRGQLLGLLGAVFGISFMIGPLIAGVLLRYFAWNVLFIINLPISVVLIYYSFKILPSKINLRIAKIDWKGIVFLGIALASFTFGINDININTLYSEENKLALGAFVITLISLFVLFISERRGTNPIIKFSFFRNSQIVIIGLGLSILAGSSLRYIMLNSTTADDRAVSQGMLTIFISTGQLIGTAVFGLIIGTVVSNESFRYIFFVMAVTLFLTLILTLRLKLSPIQ